MLYSVRFKNLWMDKTALITTFTSNSRKLSWQKFHDYLACDFTVHYTCRDAETDHLKSTSANGFKLPLIIPWDYSERFSWERYIGRYVLWFSCKCARVHFSLVIAQPLKKFGSTISFFFVGFFPICQKKKKCTNSLCNSLDLHALGNKRMRSVVGHLIVFVTG